MNHCTTEAGKNATFLLHRASFSPLKTRSRAKLRSPRMLICFLPELIWIAVLHQTVAIHADKTTSPHIVRGSVDRGGRSADRFPPQARTPGAGPAPSNRRRIRLHQSA